jgi:hypothetical protein
MLALEVRSGPLGGVDRLPLQLVLLRQSASMRLNDAEPETTLLVVPLVEN